MKNKIYAKVKHADTRTRTTMRPHARVYCSKDVQDGATFMAHGNEKLFQDGIMVAHSAHHVSKGKDVKLVLQMTNTNPYPVTYRRGQILGNAEQVDIMVS